MLASDEENLTQLHMLAAKSDLRYWNRILVQVMMMRPGTNEQLTAFIDSSWGTNNEKHKSSRSIIMIMFGEIIIHAICNLQTCILSRSTEAKWMALLEATNFMASTIVDQTRSSTKNLEHFTKKICYYKMGNWRKRKHFSRRKHIDVRQNHVITEIESKTINFVYILTENMRADFLTKSLGRKDFNLAVKNAAIFRVTWTILHLTPVHLQKSDSKKGTTRRG